MLFAIDESDIVHEKFYLRPQESVVYYIESTYEVNIYAHAVEQGDIGVYIYQKSETDPNSKVFLTTCFKVDNCEVKGLTFGPDNDGPRIINLSEEPQTVIFTITRKSSLVTVFLFVIMLSVRFFC